MPLTVTLTNKWPVSSHHCLSILPRGRSSSQRDTREIAPGQTGSWWTMGWEEKDVSHHALGRVMYLHGDRLALSSMFRFNVQEVKGLCPESSDKTPRQTCVYHVHTISLRKGHFFYCWFIQYRDLLSKIWMIYELLFFWYHDVNIPIYQMIRQRYKVNHCC